MKKVAIILLSVLISLSFISCQKDNTEEVIKNYEDYLESVYHTNVTNELLEYLILSSPKDENYKYEREKYTENDKLLLMYKMDMIFSQVRFLDKYYDLSDDVIVVKISEIESISGKISGTYEDDKNYDTSISDLKIKFKYDSYNVRGEKINKETESGELSISITASRKEKDDMISVTASSLSINGISVRDISYKYDNIMEKYTEAKVDGNSIDLRLLNSGN